MSEQPLPPPARSVVRNPPLRAVSSPLHWSSSWVHELLPKNRSLINRSLIHRRLIHRRLIHRRLINCSLIDRNLINRSLKLSFTPDWKPWLRFSPDRKPWLRFSQGKFAPKTGSLISPITRISTTTSRIQAALSPAPPQTARSGLTSSKSQTTLSEY